jgi:hypothetical protein
MHTRSPHVARLNIPAEDPAVEQRVVMAQCQTFGQSHQISRRTGGNLRHGSV